MKILAALLFLAVELNFVSHPEQQPKYPQFEKQDSTTENIFLITTDGFRWNEIFNGADSSLINDEEYTKDTELCKLLYWADTPEERRKRLMPFLWNVVAAKGQLFGNREYANEVNVNNIYGFSYPGYNELLTGTTDIMVNSNHKYYNRNKNFLEKLNGEEKYHNKVAAFTSWDVFPYILNDQRNEITINSGYSNAAGNDLTEGEQKLNAVQTQAVRNKKSTRYDMLTFVSAKEFIDKNHPKILYIGFGETDESAHSGRYDMYLKQANQFDKFLEELWYYVQTNDIYKNKTTFIITTDHGRGYQFKSSWTRHGPLTPGSKKIWAAMIGPGIAPLGEIKEADELKQKNISKLIMHMLGEEKEAATNNTLMAVK
jgi:hypothetical protein